KTIMPPATKPARRKARILTIGLVSMMLAAGPAMAENDYGDFVKIPTSQRKTAEAAKKNNAIQPQATDATAETDMVAVNHDETPHLVLASVSTKPFSAAPSMRYPSIFGANETRYDDLTPFTKWSGVLERFRTSFKASMHKPVTQNWMNFLKAASELDREDQVKAVNTYMNKVKFIADKDNYSMNDYWATPMQFMARGGDCEDYAIAKYVSLRALGFQEKQLRLAIVYDHEMRMPHAVLVVYDQNKAVVLDNQTPDVKNAAKIRRYQPLYSINQLAWWRH
ncbi:MAG TPA: transglutaminase-like cysteine peptidase, partial [Alphaproteobacteria bacterium]